MVGRLAIGTPLAPVRFQWPSAPARGAEGRRKATRWPQRVSAKRAPIVGEKYPAALIQGDRGILGPACNRVPLGFTYGQRVDLLGDLIENKGTAGEIDRMEAFWRAELGRVAQRL